MFTPLKNKNNLYHVIEYIMMQLSFRAGIRKLFQNICDEPPKEVKQIHDYETFNTRSAHKLAKDQNK